MKGKMLSDSAVRLSALNVASLPCLLLCSTVSIVDVLDLSDRDPVMDGNEGWWASQ